MVSIDIIPKWKERLDAVQIYSLQLSPDSVTIAAALSNGTIELRSLVTGRTSYTLVHSPNNFAVSAIRFHPQDPHTFYAISPEGTIKSWSKKVPELVWARQEEENELYALDLDHLGQRIATAGTDARVRIYDPAINALTCTLTRRPRDQLTSKGHSDRIYCVKFHPSNENLLISGGWDNTIQIWDLRNSESVGCLPGPHICGDSLDIHGDMVLAGSWRVHDQLQFFDLRNNALLKSLGWSLAGVDKQCQIYIAKFFNSGKNFIAGGSGVNQLKVFSSRSFTSVGSALAFLAPVYAAAVTVNSQSLVVGTEKGDLMMHAIQPVVKSDLFLTSPENMDD
jgi:WD40 repeat protein